MVKLHLDRFFFDLGAFYERFKMASRTYIPQLVRFLRRVCVYIARYRDVLVEHLPTGGAAALDAVLVACSTLIDLTDTSLED